MSPNVKRGDRFIADGLRVTVTHVDQDGAAEIAVQQPSGSPRTTCRMPDSIPDHWIKLNAAGGAQ